MRFLLAITPAEVAELMAELPPAVLRDLTSELKTSGEAHRYHLETRCANYLRQERNRLACWQWRGVETYDEAGRLLAAIVDLDGPLKLDAAERLYREAKNRPPIGQSVQSQPSP